VGISVLSVFFFAASADLIVLALLMLVSPGKVSLSLGAPLLGGLEVAGPYAFLLAGAMLGLVGVGLLRLHRWARRTAILVAAAGLAGLIPRVSSAVIGFQWGTLASAGLQVILRVLAIYYLCRAPVVEAFAPGPKQESVIPHSP
jgi:hypothetical protein